MFFFDYKEFDKIKRKHYDPTNPTSKRAYKNPDQCERLGWGIVDNNKDPDKMGRIKVAFPLLGNNIISDWVPLVSKSSGFWMLPDVGDKVICVFLNDDINKPLVIGSIFTHQARPPVKDNKGNNLKMFTSKTGSKIIFDDTKGEEKIVIEGKEGKIRMVLDTHKGLAIENELGNIRIKCRKFMMRAGDDAIIESKKDMKISSKQGDIILKAKNIEFDSGKDVVFKGKKIKLMGYRGVTAEGKQIATRNDQVLGIDMHDIEVPVPKGTQTVPSVPHPHLAKLTDKLSQDVEVNKRSVAVKGSKSKFLDPGHVVMPPGIKFTKQPSQEGEVSSGTISSVKVNGKEVAVLGSKVKTCNDPVDQETCQIYSQGVAVPLPIMMPGMDPDAFKRAGGTIFNTRDLIKTKPSEIPSDAVRSINNPKWSKTKANVGEEITLSAKLTNQYDYTNVYFTIWEQGADKEKDQPVDKLSGLHVGGKVEVKWRYQYIHDPDNPLTEKPKFFFTVKSFKCDEVEAGSIEFSENYKTILKDIEGNILKNIKCKVIAADGKENNITSNSGARIDVKKILPGDIESVPDDIEEK